MNKPLYYIIGERDGETAQLLFTWASDPDAGIKVGEGHARIFGKTFDRIVAERIEPDEE